VIPPPTTTTSNFDDFFRLGKLGVFISCHSDAVVMTSFLCDELETESARELNISGPPFEQFSKVNCLS
jgi:hypothetical protein